MYFKSQWVYFGYLLLSRTVSGLRFCSQANKLTGHTRSLGFYYSAQWEAWTFIFGLLHRSCFHWFTTPSPSRNPHEPPNLLKRLWEKSALPLLHQEVWSLLSRTGNKSSSTLEGDTTSSQAVCCTNIIRKAVQGCAEMPWKIVSQRYILITPDAVRDKRRGKIKW